MGSFKLTIKHAGKPHEIELDESDTGLAFKEKIRELTNIPPERQKILIKGGKLGDDVKVSSLNLNPKQAIMVLGTPDAALPSKPIEKQVFLEDLNKNGLVQVSHDPSGLINLGNTCYLNSTLQALFHIKELKEKIDQYKATGENSGTGSESLTVSLGKLFSQMSKKQEKVNPIIFLTLFRNVYPQFAEQQNGFYKQQDAEEAFSQILTSLNTALKTSDVFRLSFKEDQKCLGAPEEPVKTNYVDSLKLNCHISIKTNFLKDGILDGLKESIEKFSDTLQSNTEYEINRKIVRLPKVLTVQFVRFYWRRDTQKKSKILRRVQFPFELDLADMLDDSIKAEKISARDNLRKIEKDNEELVRDFKKSRKEQGLNPIQQEEEDKLKILSIKSKLRDDFKKILPEGVDIDTTTENPSSVYELSAVITHSGSSADSGHYQAFVRDEDDLDGERWWRFNDDKVSSISKERIETLAGGGESDSALILIYRAAAL
ncbi:Piso0_000853 [Millerozyma farinosa CBS 7064]|uniref:Ubiquitin carboxyl-terminal hydrolase n=1 Tax=Pichia sorbitophila (strain ATCC MYA-4447 / BCRC 22081 / CBS 7064 / NBRC 10061 / NRRL Y-12695) TaxID=559304 RepID=G8YRP8_PICSO|nr:Piso0_000853 [Millerozyma farinosa CBS 7064]